MSAVFNEQTKLLANTLDRASTACVALGVFGPAAAYLYGSSEPDWSTPNWRFVIGPLIWLIAAVLLHLAARFALRSLK